jgi:hypothetical protein
MYMSMNLIAHCISCNLKLSVPINAVNLFGKLALISTNIAVKTILLKNCPHHYIKNNMKIFEDFRPRIIGICEKYIKRTLYWRSVNTLALGFNELTKMATFIAETMHK